MEDLLEKLKNAPTILKVSLVVLFGSAINLWTYLEEMPTLEQKLVEAENYKNVAQKRYEKAKEEVANLTNLEVTLKNTQDDLTQAKRYLPDEVPMDETLHTTARFCKRYNVELTKFEPMQEEVSEDLARYAIKPVSVSLVGRFVDIARFFDSMVHLQKIVHLRNITLNKFQEEGDEEETLNLFRLTPEQRQRFAERNTKVSAQAELMLYKSDV